MGGVELGEGGRGGVGGVGAVAEDPEEREVGAVVGRAGEGLDLRGGEELGEDECVWGSGCARDEVGGCAGGGGGFGEC